MKRFIFIFLLIVLVACQSDEYPFLEQFYEELEKFKLDAAIDLYNEEVTNLSNGAKIYVDRKSSKELVNFLDQLVERSNERIESKMTLLNRLEELSAIHNDNRKFTEKLDELIEKTKNEIENLTNDEQKRVQKELQRFKAESRSTFDYTLDEIRERYDSISKSGNFNEEMLLYKDKALNVGVYMEVSPGYATFLYFDEELERPFFVEVISKKRTSENVANEPDKELNEWILAYILGASKVARLLDINLDELFKGTFSERFLEIVTESEEINDHKEIGDLVAHLYETEEHLLKFDLYLKPNLIKK